MKNKIRQILFALLFLPLCSVSAQGWQETLLAIPSADSCRAYLARLTEKPHVAGTLQDYETAEYVLQKFRDFGLQAEMQSYDVYLPYPQKIELRIIKPHAFSGPTPERVIGGESKHFDEIIAGYNAYSPSGEVYGKVVYANYGRAEDYETLADMGIGVDGKIVIARYGGVYRGVKARQAEEHGAIGLILYSDPANDGYMRGDIYPDGPFRPGSAVQRGTIQYMFLHPGDPLTKGYAATSDARRLAEDEAENLPRILTLPVSYNDAAKILKELDGPNVPQGWQGGLPFAYHVGAGAVEIMLTVEMDYEIRPVWNVIGRMPGAEEAEQTVILGSHRDAWTYGAVDPGSGTSVLLETARAFGELSRRGFKSRRTLVFASWDAEEFGLLGSTEWVEDRRADLAKNCVAYFNLDATVSGRNFHAIASPGLKPLVQEIAESLQDPLSGRKVTARQNQSQQDTPSNVFKVGDLGAGTDYTAFFHFAGVPSLMYWYAGDYGVYHSAYDNFHWMTMFGDPGFLYHKTMTKLTAATILRLADDPVIPFSISAYASEILQLAHELKSDLRRASAPDNADATPIIEKCREWLRVAATIPKIEPESLRDFNTTDLNRQLIDFEKSFLTEKGLPGRDWYKHLLFAPGLDTGYAPQAFPGVRYFLKRRAWASVEAEIEKILLALERAKSETERLASAYANFE